MSGSSMDQCGKIGHGSPTFRPVAEWRQDRRWRAAAGGVRSGAPILRVHQSSLRLVDARAKVGFLGRRSFPMGEELRPTLTPVDHSLGPACSPIEAAVPEGGVEGALRGSSFG